MKVAGIDISTFHIDVVFVAYDDEQPGVHWHRFTLTGHDAFDRARSVADTMPGRASVFWDDTIAVGIEEPAGRNPGVIFRVQGAVLAQIPARTLVDKLMPSQWRKQVGLAGNATKTAVAEHALADLHSRGALWTLRDHPQDALDAYCIAQATRDRITIPNAA